MRRSGIALPVLAVLAMMVAGLAVAQNAGHSGGQADVWSFRSPRAKAAKKTYDLGARKASDRYLLGLARIRKPLLYALETARKQAERQGDQAEVAKLEQAAEVAGNGGLIPPTTETVGWSAKFGGHSYMAVLAPVKWDQARKLSKKLGGHLACIDTREEMVFLQKLTSGVGVYVGAADVGREGDWRWVNGRPVNKALWKIREPDGGGGQNYAALSTAGLYDVSDGEMGMKGFICEWDP